MGISLNTIDLEYPAEIKQFRENLSLCPYQTQACKDFFGEYMDSVEQTNYNPTTKLTCDLTDKTNYMAHYRNLKF